MNFTTALKNIFSSGYKNDPDAVIIACYFNPQRNEYRKKAFDIWYDSIKHLNHRIIECTDRNGVFELPPNINILQVRVDQMLWHKETLLNILIGSIIDEGKFKYIFWLDTDVIFDNKNWLVLACHELQFHNVVQPFEYCVHMERDINPYDSSFYSTGIVINDNELVKIAKNYKIWRSFGANVSNKIENAMSDNYDIHGHVGFAWGARVDYLKEIGGLYDKALIGGSDHIMAHAFVGQVPCECITKSFGDLDDIRTWSMNAFRENLNTFGGGISYVKGNLFHIWHGDIEKREYYKRIKEFTPISENKIKRNDDGFHSTADPLVQNYFMNYFNLREDVDFPIRMGGVGTTIDDLPEKLSAYEGGEFGGGGAGADWGENPTTTEQTDSNYNPTFS